MSDDSSNQNENTPTEALKQKCLLIRKMLVSANVSDARIRYDIAAQVQEAMADVDKYGEHAIEYLAAKLECKPGDIRDYARVARRWTSTEFEPYLEDCPEGGLLSLFQILMATSMAQENVFGRKLNDDCLARALAARTQAKAVLERLLDEGIRPHVETIASASAAGEVAVVFYDIESEATDFGASARKLGWRGGRSECLSLNRACAEDFADGLSSADPASQWLHGLRAGRIFVWACAARLCINYVPWVGFSFEPGSTDSTWMG